MPKSARRPVRLLLAILLAGTFALPARAQGAPEGDLVILHTNDIHGGFLAEKQEGREGEPARHVGGFRALDTWLRAHRKDYPASLLLDAGDLMTGNPICETQRDGIYGVDLVEMMNLVGYDATVIGNHDLDDGLSNLEGLIKVFRFPVLAANLTRIDGSLVAPEPYHLYPVGPFKVGVIGLVWDGYAKVVGAATMAKLQVASAAETAKRWIAELDPKTDVIILLTHQGLDHDRELAQHLGPEVDLIVGGHSHAALSQPVMANGIPIVQAGCSLNLLGKVTLHVKDDKAVSVRGELIRLEETGEPGPEMQALVTANETRVMEKFGEVIGVLENGWSRNYYGESSLGNFVTDCLREKYGADFAVMNSGSLRKNLPAGDIRRIDLYEIYPFANPVVRFEITGAELLTILHRNAWSAVTRDHGILQVSGVRYTWARKGDADGKILEATVAGEPIVPEKIYRGVSGNFVAADKAEKYLGLRLTRWQDTADTVRGVLEEAIRAKKTVTGRIEGRIQGPN